jgi:adenylate cyclase
MSVFFSDLEGFTAICEGLTPTGVVGLLNQYFSVMSESIRANHGIIDKYIGDSIMAFWGPPFSNSTEHATQSCLAAIEQQKNVAKFQSMLPDILGIRKNVPIIRVRMGISTGDVTVGSIGSEESRSYTVIGDTVNLASRLESANKQYGTQILISDDTHKLAEAVIEVREIDAILVVGKTEPIRVFELLGKKGTISAETKMLRTEYERGLALYRDRQWDEAGIAFATCLTINAQDGPASEFARRIETLKRQTLPEHWNGVWVLTQK